MVSISRRSMLHGLALWGSHSLFARHAGATTALALSVEQLVRASARIALVRPVDKVTGWEHFAGRRTIVTHTRVVVQEHWTDAEESELFVRTLGGRVGEVQQKAYGEAALHVGEDCLVFLGSLEDGGFSIAGMAQGHYPMELHPSQARLFHSPELPRLVGRGPDAAVGAFHERSVTHARALVGKFQ